MPERQPAQACRQKNLLNRSRAPVVLLVGNDASTAGRLQWEAMRIVSWLPWRKALGTSKNRLSRAKARKNAKM